VNFGIEAATTADLIITDKATVFQLTHCENDAQVWVQTLISLSVAQAFSQQVLRSAWQLASRACRDALKFLNFFCDLLECAAHLHSPITKRSVRCGVVSPHLVMRYLVGNVMF
jgi:hypothetical protein